MTSCKILVPSTLLTYQGLGGNQMLGREWCSSLQYTMWACLTLSSWRLWECARSPTCLLALLCSKWLWQPGKFSWWWRGEWQGLGKGGADHTVSWEFVTLPSTWSCEEPGGSPLPSNLLFSTSGVLWCRLCFWWSWIIPGFRVTFPFYLAQWHYPGGGGLVLLVGLQVCC